MNIILIFNGLGNQMSQYAFYLAKKQYDSQVKYLYFPDKNVNQHNNFELEDVFSINESRGHINSLLNYVYGLFDYAESHKGRKGKLLKTILKYLGVNLIVENSNYDYDSSYLLNKTIGTFFYYGGWHSEKYFSNIKTQINDSFKFNVNLLDVMNLEILKEVCERTSVSIHIRRCDYLQTPFKDVSTIEYYKKAINYIEERIEKPFYFIFSDDIVWVKQNFDIPNSMIVDNNKAKDSWKDMYLISKCKHNINANSTFSWWGAWLNDNTEKIVITPRKFSLLYESNDIYPESWVKID